MIARPANRNRLVRCCAVAVLLISAPAYAQQDGKGPFDFLKPWIERQILGKDVEGSPERPTGSLSEGDAVEGADPASAAPVLRGTSETEDAAPTESAPPESAVAEPAPPALPEAAPADEAKLQPLRFAVLAGRSAAATMATVGPIAEDLENLLGRPVEFLPLPSYGAMIDAQVERRIDGGFYSAAAFAMADTRCSCLEPLVAPRAFDGTLAYHAIIVARADSGIGAVAGLAGKTVAIAAGDSIGARRMQLAGLMSEGLDPATAFGSVVEVESAEEAVRRVAAGQADAAFAWSSLAGRIQEGYSRGTLANLIAHGEISMDDVTILWRSPAIEHGPFALLRSIPEDEKAKVEAYLVAMMTENPAAYDVLNPFYGGGYAPVDPRDYAGIDVLAAEDIDALRMPVAEPRRAPAAVIDARPAEAVQSE